MLCVLRGESCLWFFCYFTSPGPELESIHFWVITQYLKPIAEQGALRLLGLMKTQVPWSLGSAWGGEGGGQGLSYHFFPPQKAPEELSFLENAFIWIAYFYISQPPPLGGICPVPDGDVLSSQAPTICTIQAVKITSLFLGCICMSSPPLSDCSVAGATRPDGGAQRRWRGVRSALHWEPTCDVLGQTQGERGVPSESN